MCDNYDIFWPAARWKKSGAGWWRACYPIGERIIGEKAAGKPNSFEKAVSDRNTVLLLAIARTGSNNVCRFSAPLIFDLPSFRLEPLRKCTRRTHCTHYVSLMLIVGRVALYQRVSFGNFLVSLNEGHLASRGVHPLRFNPLSIFVNTGSTDGSVVYI